MLIARQGDPQVVLHALSEETGAEGIFAEADISPYARLRDERLKRELPLALLPGVTVHPCANLHKADGSPYTVFTTFSRMWRSLPFPGSPFAAPERLPALPALPSLDLPSKPRHPANSPSPAGESEAQRRLAAFTDLTINRYAEDRNRMDLDGASGLSPYLRLDIGRSAVSAAETWAARHSMADIPENAEVLALLDQLNG